ncbi:50S ribosomal protein L13 [Ignicoccus pacificus DSM 13166]|uniref:Large ribosomal subunit protein uL13 n=1 Tax=Ignicoccus pacificus DSM 13166 TaxID=940294 RepID=A0A977KAX8_9CREN|nr:50S ribosomal protein L13 [Ignicoccus pacificus DSM 13166]
MENMKRVVIVDGANQILGRMASHVAKMALEGYEVHIINAEKVVLSGKPEMVVNAYQLLLDVKTHKNPYRTKIKRPRTPVALVKDAIKGMLPKHNTRGREAFKRVKAYIGTPELKVKGEVIRFLDADARRLSGKYITVGEVAKRMGWKGEA